mmetsp:Transcript_52863/g.115353  ORF Transcript_52863/g.115353 Transcript_52863/m.115353 type:complete len:183 (+) Transcript_52863:24-572(+)
MPCSFRGRWQLRPPHPHPRRGAQAELIKMKVCAMPSAAIDKDQGVEAPDDHQPELKVPGSRCKWRLSLCCECRGFSDFRHQGAACCHWPSWSASLEEHQARVAKSPFQKEVLHFARASPNLGQGFRAAPPWSPYGQEVLQPCQNRGARLEENLDGLEGLDQYVGAVCKEAKAKRFAMNDSRR